MRPHPVFSVALGDRRRRLLALARGRVVDVGGFLDNGPHYPAGVSVHDVGADELAALPESGFDTVVCTLVLCTFDDVGRALAAVRRVMAPDGRLLFLEHVAGGPTRRLLQRLAAPGWSRVFDGCHPDRDTVAAVRDAGFFITDLDRFFFRAAAPVISPGVQGVARVAA
jgi:SAM-dependent methyltransferase